MKKKKLINKVSKLATAALVLSTVITPWNSFHAKAETTPGTATLRILETTDLHSNVRAYDYYQDTDKNIKFGLAKTATLIAQARSEKANSMLFDAGDLIQGNPLADYVAKVDPLGPDETHPIIRAMNYLDYDAGIVGNHEFNYGLPYMEKVLGKADHPIVNANIYKDNGADGDSSNDTENYFTPYEILDKEIIDDAGVKHTVKVGVVGFAPPQILNWDYDNLYGKVTVKDIVQTANKYVKEMRDKGADVVVAIAHSGCDVTNDGQAEAENAVYSLSKVSGIDALLFGHAHQNFPAGKEFHVGGDASQPDLPGINTTKGTINGTPAVEAGYWGNNLGVLDLALVEQNGKWIVDKANSKSVDRPVAADTPEDQHIVTDVQPEHDGTLTYVRGKVGETSAPLYSYFSLVPDDPTVQIVNNAQTAYVKKWIEDKNPELKDLPILSAGAPFKAGGKNGGPSYYTNIPTGELSIKSANDLYLYPNTLKAVKVNGATIREWLEMSAGQFNTVDPKNLHPQSIINESFPTYNFDVIDGVNYQIDITQPPRYTKDGTNKPMANPNSHRIVNLTYKGQPIKDDQWFIVATNNYRAGGGGFFPGLDGKEEVIVNSPDESRQVLIDYIKAQGTVNPSADNNWSFAPMNDKLQLTFKSSPSAKVYADASENIHSLGNVQEDGNTWGLYSLDNKIHVQLLGINDFHGQLDTWRSIKDKDGNVVDYSGGIEYLGAYLKRYEAENPANTLMLQAGDLVGASPPVSALLQDEPTIRFMNELGFDVGTIGNHEFDEGVTEMKRLIKGGSHPKTKQYEQKYGEFTGSTMDYVVANVVDEKTKEPILPPYTIKEVNGVKFGFIGVVTTETPSIVTASGVKGVVFTDEVKAINKYTKELKSKGVKNIVVLAHDPGTSKTDGTNATGRVIDMAKDIDSEVDVIYGAHDHKYLNTNVDGKIVVQSWSYGTAFSDIDLTIDPITKEIVAGSAKIVDTLHSKITPDAKIKAELDGYQEDIKPITGQLVGEAAVDLTREASAAGETALGNLIADGMRVATNTDFAFMNVGGIRNDLKKGPLTWGDLFKVQPFGNDIVTMKITGDQVRTLLNQQYNAPPSYNKIMQISGLRYTWNDKLPIGQKVLDIFLPNGKKIDPKAEYSITVNNFMADGGDGFVVLKQGKERKTWMTDLEAFVEYVKAQKGPILAKIEGRILLAESATPDTPTPAPVVIVKPVVKAGKATIDSKDFTSAIEKAVKEKTGLTIDLGKEKNIKVDLTPEQVTQLKANGVPLMINNDNVKVAIPLANLTGKDFEFVLNRYTDNSDAKSPVYDFTIIIDGKEVHQFAEPITLTFDVDTSKVKNTNDLKVFYYNETTKKWELVPGAVYKDGKVEVKTPHFSTFAVFEVAGDQTEIAASTPKPLPGNVLPKTASNMYNFLLYGILIMSFGAALVFRRRKLQA
jgi:2',3'-cyclic-nucleotide 2'-phosphodiesterase / 3'-nucleotidase / 5'-nucleotidase